MKRSLYRICAIACALALSMPVFLAACMDGETDKTGQPDTDTSTSGGGEETTFAAEAETTASPFDENGYLLDSLPLDLNFGGETFTIAHWDDTEHVEFTVENQNGEIVNDAIFARNQTVEERLGVTLNYVGFHGNTSNIDKFLTNVRSVTQSGSREYKLIGTYSRTAASLAYNGLLQDMRGLDYLDFDKPWWPDSLLEESEVNGKLFFASGDISTNLLHMMYVTFFTKPMIADFGLENPYDLVRENKWTLDKMLSMTAGIYADLNGDSKKDAGDRFGFMTSTLHLDPFYFSCGLKTTELDAEGKLIMSPDFGGEKNQAVVEKLANAVHNTNDSFINSTSSGVPATTAMSEERVLFIADRARTAFTVLSKNDTFAYGVVPMAKYDEAQERYYTAVGFPYSLYCIPVDNDRPEVAAAVMECLASESYRRVTPALFETTMKVKYAGDETAAQMYDLIRESVSFDLGRLFYDSLANATVSYFRNNIKDNRTDIAAQHAAVADALDRLIERVQEIYE